MKKTKRALNNNIFAPWVAVSNSGRYPLERLAVLSVLSWVGGVCLSGPLTL